MKAPKESLMTFEEASVADAKFRRSLGPQRPEAEIPGPLQRWMAYKSIERAKLSFEKGNPKALMDAVASCAWAQIPMPEWVASEFLTRWRDVDQLQIGSWDEAFGRPHKKNTNLEAKRKRYELSALVYRKVTESSRPIDESLFEEIGQGLSPPISGSRARDFYYDAKPIYDQIEQMRESARRENMERLGRILRGEEKPKPFEKRLVDLLRRAHPQRDAASGPEVNSKVRKKVR